MFFLLQIHLGKYIHLIQVVIYFFDDDRHTWEYTLGMEEFPEVDPREARRLSAAPENWDVWGAEPEPGFGESGTVA